MKALFALILISLCLGVAGCKTVPKDKEESQSYTPHSERPTPAKEYWEERERQDRTAEKQTLPPTGP